MNTIKRVVVPVKQFVINHKTTAFVVLTAAICAKIGRDTIEGYDSFLKDHNLYEEFHTTTDEETSA